MRDDIKAKIWFFIYGGLLIGFSVFVLLDTFVIPRTYADVKEKEQAREEYGQQESGTTGGEDTSRQNVEITDTSYKDENISIVIDTCREYDTNIYVADVTLSSGTDLKTALAEDIYGKNITAKTSEIAKEHDAILAINGDFYGSQNDGYVIRKQCAVPKKFQK